MSATILPLLVDRLAFAAGGRPILKSLSFRLLGGPVSVILGPNGAGKSVLLRLLHGLLKPTAGQVRWCGANGTDPARLQAMVFQRPVMLRRSAAANVDYALALRRVPTGERRARVMEVLARTGLDALANRPARVLSAGEQQKLALARAWALEPHVLFLDEPTASLDPAATGAVEDIIRAIHKGGAKVIMTTHDLGQARRLADEVLFLHDGRLHEHARADAFFTAPATVEAASFLAGRLLVPGGA